MGGVADRRLALALAVAGAIGCVVLRLLFAAVAAAGPYDFEGYRLAQTAREFADGQGLSVRQIVTLESLRNLESSGHLKERWPGAAPPIPSAILALFFAVGGVSNTSVLFYGIVCHGLLCAILTWVVARHIGSVPSLIVVGLVSLNPILVEEGCSGRPDPSISLLCGLAVVLGGVVAFAVAWSMRRKIVVLGVLSIIGLAMWFGGLSPNGVFSWDDGGVRFPRAEVPKARVEGWADLFREELAPGETTEASSLWTGWPRHFSPLLAPIFLIGVIGLWCGIGRFFRGRIRGWVVVLSALLIAGFPDWIPIAAKTRQLRRLAVPANTVDFVAETVLPDGVVITDRAPDLAWSAGIRTILSTAVWEESGHRREGVPDLDLAALRLKGVYLSGPFLRVHENRGLLATTFADASFRGLFPRRRTFKDGAVFFFR